MRFMILLKEWILSLLQLTLRPSNAVLRALEIIGEAANRIPKEVRLLYEEVEWGKIIRSRNLIIHEYEIIDYSVVWKIVTVHLEPLKIL
jgi:uncharacterized protein with HEPN domain